MKTVDSRLLAALTVLLLATSVVSAHDPADAQDACEALSSGQAVLQDGSIMSGGLTPVRAISGARKEVVEMSVVAAGLDQGSKCEFRVDLEVRDARGQVVATREGVLSGSSKVLFLARPFAPARDRPRETITVGATVRKAKTSSDCTCREALGLRTILAVYDETTGKTVDNAPGNLLLGTSFSTPLLLSE